MADEVTPGTAPEDIGSSSLPRPGAGARRLACPLALAAALVLTTAAAHSGTPARQQETATPAPSSSGWSATTVVEPESAEEIPAAVVHNAAGFALAIAREPGSDRVIGILRLPPADQDFLDDSRSLEIRIDAGPRIVPRRLGGGLKSATFFLWDGAGEPAVGPLRDLMEAHDGIVVVYPLGGGGHKETTLAAQGARAAIASVLGVAEIVAPEARELAVARQEAVERCLSAAKPKDRDRCMEQLTGCVTATTAEELRGCIAGARKSKK